MNRKWRGWIVPVVFWTLFLTSIGLGKRYPWLDTVWYIAGMLFLLGVSVYSVAYAVRHRGETGSISYKGIPRRLERFSLDEEGRER